VPEVAELQPLDRLLRQWPEDRCLYWCDEAAIGQPAEITGPAGPAAILIGPEGGFSADEAAKLRGMPNVAPLSLGPRILRADTAAVAAITLWQARHGDWR
jgi:16S rRNA (uracil1498-N3)-methyltransferase